MTHIYLGLTLLVATIGAFTDIRFGRVQNKHLVIALATWLILIISESIFLHSFSLVIPIFSLTLNVALAFATSLIFYLTDIWAPGDSKLYIVISIIFPMHAYVIREGNIFPSLDFVIYAFAMGYITLLAIIILRKAREKRNGTERDTKLKLSLNHILSILTNIGAISCVNTILDIYAYPFFYANQMLCILATIGLICLLQQKTNTVRKILGFIGLLYFLFQTAIYDSWISTCLSLGKSLVIASIVEFINNRAYANTYREISEEEVRPGMILSYSTLWAMRNCIDHELPRTTTENRRSRITERQANAIKTWCRNAKSNVIIVEMIPFAPFIASAVLIQILRFSIFVH